MLWDAFYLDNELTFVAKADSGPAHRARPPPLLKKNGGGFCKFLQYVSSKLGIKHHWVEEIHALLQGELIENL